MQDEEGGAADDEMAGKSQDQASTSDGCISAGHGFRVSRELPDRTGSRLSATQNSTSAERVGFCAVTASLLIMLYLFTKKQKHVFVGVS